MLAHLKFCHIYIKAHNLADKIVRNNNNNLSEILISGSPFTCKIYESSQVMVSGSGIKLCHINRAAFVTIDL